MNEKTDEQLKHELDSQAKLIAEANKTAKRNWLNQSPAVEFVTELRNKRDRFIKDAESVANAFPVNQEKLLVLLTLSRNLRDIIETLTKVD